MSCRAGWGCAHTILIALILASGCATRRTTGRTAPAPGLPNQTAWPATVVAPSGEVVRQVTHVTPQSPTSLRETVSAAAVSFRAPVNATEIPSPLPLEVTPESLDLAAYVNEVLGRNRSLQSMVAAWRAAAEKYPQAVALDDPMFTTMTAPGSWNSNNVSTAYLLGASQKIPWRGKRSLRGEVAQAEARAASMDVADARLQLTQAAHLAYFDYYLVHRQLELTSANLRNLEENRTSARRQYEANLVMQQDVLQAEVELAEAERRRIELERIRRTAVARLNTLVHRPPDYPVPPPPASLTIDNEPAPPELLRQVAAEQRPDLASMRAKLQADSASLALAYKEFFPDLEVMARYDRFWQPTSTQGGLQGQVGVKINVPIYLEKRRAAAREAMFKLQLQRAEYEQKTDSINQELESAHAQVVEMRAIVRLYQDRTLPAAAQNVASARSDYVANRGDFLRLVSAQRQLLMLQEKHQEALVGYLSRLAELERVVGGAIPMETPPEMIPPTRPIPMHVE